MNMFTIAFIACALLAAINAAYGVLKDSKEHKASHFGAAVLLGLLSLGLAMKAATI